MLRTVALFIFLLLTIQSVTAQESGIITVSATGEVELPADIIRFNINLNAEADTPQQAFNLHRQREDVLVQLLEMYDIEESDIRFQPVSINRNFRNNFNDGREQEEFFQTSQQVVLSLEEFDVYENIQVRLIENNFDNFSGYFLSSMQEEGEDRALRQAINEARSKAQIIADESGIELGEIKKINLSQSQAFQARAATESMMMRASDDQSLMEYGQTVVIRASVSIEFSF